MNATRFNLLQRHVAAALHHLYGWHLDEIAGTFDPDPSHGTVTPADVAAAIEGVHPREVSRRAFDQARRVHREGWLPVAVRAAKRAPVSA